MSVPADLFGIAYLDAESFRAGAPLFGVGMSLCDYPANDAGNEALDRVLQAASRVIDAECGVDFIPDTRTERHHFNFETRQVRVNNPPVAEVSSFKVIFSPGSEQVFLTSDLFINNQLNYVEITDVAVGLGIITEFLNLGLSNPVAIISYKSRQEVPKQVALACGYQAAKMINEGFVDKTLPANFGQLDMEGMTVNNKKGYALKQEDIQARVLEPTAEKLLAAFKPITIR